MPDIFSHELRVNGNIVQGATVACDYELLCFNRRVLLRFIVFSCNIAWLLHFEPFKLHGDFKCCLYCVYTFIKVSIAK